MGLFDDVSLRVKQAASSISPTGTVATVAKAAVGKFAPKMYGPAARLMNGDVVGAFVSAARSKLGELNPNFAKLLSGTLRNPLLGGITMSEAQRIHSQVQSTKYAKKNLFFIEILDFWPGKGGAQTGGSNPFNLFATNVSFGPYTVTSEAKPIGSAVIDGVTGSERVELRVTTYDDAHGTLKRWFAARAEAVIRPDGTFGLPGDYLVQVRILHAAINDEVMEKFGGYEEKFIMRPTSIENELSRTEDNLEEIQMAFSQFDTFMYNNP